MAAINANVLSSLQWRQAVLECRRCRPFPERHLQTVVVVVIVIIIIIIIIIIPSCLSENFPGLWRSY
jgi:uncharacterized membrane protein YidH (DUF202 family)